MVLKTAPRRRHSCTCECPSKAEAIIVNRPYSAIDDLTRVPGIGAKTVEQLRALVTVQ